MRLSRQSFAYTWLTSFGVTALIVGVGFYDEVQSHHLERVLLPGFDSFGRNCALLALRATYDTLTIVAPTALALILTTWGFIYVEERFKESLRWWLESVLDLFSSLPGLLISLALSAFLPHQWIAFALACALILLPYLIRFFQSLQSQVTQSMPYRAAWALGASPHYLFQRYLIPELIMGLRSIWPSLLARLVLIETSFSFLGIAPKSGVDTWGRLLYQGRDFLLEAPWMIASVALPLFLTLLSFHLLTESEQS